VERSLPGTVELPRIPVSVLVVLSALELEREMPDATVSPVPKRELIVFEHPVLLVLSLEADVLPESQRFGSIGVGGNERIG